jgi:putative transcriptional regulator
MVNGNLLIATPFIIGDVDFHRSVILITASNKENVTGHIINKKINYDLNELITELNITVPLFYGGPVENDRLFFIYKTSIKVPGSKKISNNIYWCGDFNIIIENLNNKLISPEDVMFFLGYSGWEKEQLNNELLDKNWKINEDSTSDYLFLKNTDTIWKDSIKSFGDEFILWHNTPKNPNYN